MSRVPGLEAVQAGPRRQQTARGHGIDTGLPRNYARRYRTGKCSVGSL